MLVRGTRYPLLKPAAAPFSPANIPDTKLVLMSEITDTTIDGVEVATWPDQSGNGNHATQATSANRPLYRTNVVNGKPVVRFDGVNDFLSIAGAADYSAASVVMVIKYAANIYPLWSNRHLSAPSGGTIWYTGTHWNSGSTPFGWYMNNSSPADGGGGNVSNNTWHAVYYVLSSDTKMELFVDNVSVHSNTGTNRIVSLPNGYIARDDTSYAPIDVAFLQVVGHALTATERANLQTWFARYGL